MTVNPQIAEASKLLTASNFLYAAGAILTVAAALWVLHENRQVAAGRRDKYFLVSEVVVALAAFVSLIGTVGAIHFGNVVSHLKDIALAHYQADAQAAIGRARNDASAALERSVKQDLINQQTRLSAATLERLNADTAERTAKVGLLTAEAQRSAASASRLAVAAEAHVAVVDQRTAYRTLTTAQTDALLKGLTQAPGQVAIFTQGDPEAVEYANKFARIFRLAGWKVSMGTVQGPPVPLVRISAVLDRSPSGNAISSAFDSAGIFLPPSENGALTNFPTIFVGGEQAPEK